MKEQPLVSVLMTAYNREKYIAEAIESVLLSTYRNFELIIVDDCSRDNTVNIAKRFEVKDTRIKLYVNERNLGDYPNRNNAVTYAKGEFIMFVDSDDKTLPDGITNCVTAMQLFPDSSFGMFIKNNESTAYCLNSEEAIQNHFFKIPFLFIGPGGTILKRSFFNKINEYPVKYGPANDMYFNLKAVCNTPIVLLPFDFVFYRRHENQEINKADVYLIHNYTYLRDALAELPLPLSHKEINWISKKNKRRFVVNIFKYFIKTFNVRNTIYTIRQARFSFRDALIGIFH